MSDTLGSNGRWFRAAPVVSTQRLAFTTVCACMFAFAIAFAAAGCGDDAPPSSADAAADAGDASGSVCPAEDSPVNPTVLIDDFEDGNSTVPHIAGRQGDWYVSGDGTSLALLHPMGLAAPEPIPGGRCGSRRALHITGGGFETWGAVVTLALDYNTNAAGVFEDLPYDALARGYQGVTFFARVGDSSTNEVRIGISDEFERPEAGICDVNSTGSDQCYDSYGVSLSSTLSTDWTQFRLAWTDLTQRNFGQQGGSVLDLAKLYEVAFAFPDHATFDFWLDDLRFY